MMFSVEEGNIFSEHGKKNLLKNGCKVYDQFEIEKTMGNEWLSY